MICINCGKETPDTDTYCRNCGVEQNLTFDQITDKLGKDITSEKITETEVFFRWILVLVVFFMVAGWLFNRLWNVSINLTITPAYIPSIDISKNWSDIQKPLVIEEP